MTVLYVRPGGAVMSGRLEDVDGALTLRARGGRILPPGDVLAILMPPMPLSEDERIALHKAAAAGYSVERA